MTKIYTKTGDKGETSLFGGQRITKSHPRIEAYGSIDELNALLGLSIAHVQEILSDSAHTPDALQQYTSIAAQLERVQHTLFIIGSHLSTPYDPVNIPKTLPSFESKEIEEMEKWIDAASQNLPELKQFILPSGTVAGSSLHVARTVCRRSERAVIRLAAEELILTDIVRYLNRLSDYLFIVARLVNHLHGVPETPWKKMGVGEV